MIGHWEIRGYGPYVLELKENGKVIGVSGFWYPFEWPGPEIKWALARKWWNRGYAFEAASAVQRAGRVYMPDINLLSVIHPENSSSLKLAEKLGATFQKMAFFQQTQWKLYVHPGNR
jgi:RimJ/RimL family protein N-acetyltransferase